MTRQMTGAKMVVQALKDQGVDVVFGYPGGAVLPIYDEVFQQNDIRHILVRHEQGAVHAAEGYARATGKPGVVLVTSGPGATNAVTGLTDALMDSIPTCRADRPGADLHDRLGCLSGGRHGGHHPPLHQAQLAGEATPTSSRTRMHQAFHVATSGRPGPVLVDIPKDVQFASAEYVTPQKARTPLPAARSRATWT
jgi:acetolactate synthase-1/2/3 large subunit